jgi:hypothetical protein
MGRTSRRRDYGTCSAHVAAPPEAKPSDISLVAVDVESTSSDAATVAGTIENTFSPPARFGMNPITYNTQYEEMMAKYAPQQLDTDDPDDIWCAVVGVCVPVCLVPHVEASHVQLFAVNNGAAPTTCWMYHHVRKLLPAAQCKEEEDCRAGWRIGNCNVYCVHSSFI